MLRVCRSVRVCSNFILSETRAIHQPIMQTMCVCVCTCVCVATSYWVRRKWWISLRTEVVYFTPWISASVGPDMVLNCYAGRFMGVKVGEDEVRVRGVCRVRARALYQSRVACTKFAPLVGATHPRTCALTFTHAHSHAHSHSHMHTCMRAHTLTHHTLKLTHVYSQSLSHMHMHTCTCTC